MVRYVAVSGPIYGVVDASPAWVAGRLDKLAHQLLLPTPVRDGFLFDASPAFYAACTESIITLQSAAKRIVQHLGLACDSVICTFRTLPNPATIQRIGNDWFVEIASEYRNDAHALGAILAHEICHILVDERGVPHFENAVDEVHVDLAVMLSGLGALTLNAIETTSEVRGDLRYTRHRSFGYLQGPLLHVAYAHVCAALGIGVRRAIRPLRFAHARRDVAWHMLLRLRRPQLAYRPLASHVIVPCTTVTCSKRLRTPAGKPGTVRCPECKTGREFDGRGCRTRPTDTIVPMREARMPAPPNALARFALAPVAAKLWLVALTAIVVFLGVAWMRERAALGDVGERCSADRDCRSEQCLHHDGGGTCTEACMLDADCPAGMRCVAAARTLVPIAPSNPRDVLRVCAPVP